MDLRLHSGGTLQVADAVFGVDYKPALIHKVVTAYLATARAGTKAQKGRADVSGGGAKPFRQKGSGRARAGTSRSPLWRSGGVTFPARPRNFSQKVNRKMYRGAVRSIFSELVRQDRLVVVQDFVVNTPKTQDLVAKFEPLGLGSALLLVADFDENLMYACRNLPKFEVLTAEEVDPVSLVAFDKIVITAEAVKRVEERLA